MRWLVRPGVVVRLRRSPGASCLGGIGLSPRRLRLHVPGPRSVIFWTCPQSSPSLSAARSTASPTPEYSTTVFRGGPPRGQQSSVFPLSLSLIPMPGVRLRSVPAQSRLSGCLSDRPFPSRNPAFRCQLWVLSGLPAS